VRLAVVVAFVVVVLGAYVRLSDAGLGCPDWPGCYGQMVAPTSAQEQALAARDYPGSPLESEKAWKEMVHRYVAGLLGLLIGAMAVRAWWPGAGQVRKGLPTLLLLLVIFQALLGMWTVTLKLQPIVVMAHLLGGMATLSLLLLLALREGWRPAALGLSGRLRTLGLVGLLLLAGQIALGGWTSSNYAALACVDLPTCQGAWWPEMNFRQGFQLIRELGETVDGSPITHQALVAIQVTHRVGAVITALVLLLFAAGLLRRGGSPWLWGGVVLLAVSGQFLLGLANVWFALPLPVAVAHNGGAALLLLAMVTVNFALFRGWCRTTDV